MRKFKVGDRIKHVDAFPGRGESTIKEISEDRYYVESGRYLLFTDEDDYELVELSTRHVHYELIMKWAENPDKWDVYFRCNIEDAWMNVGHPTWRPNYEYELRPKRKVIKAYIGVDKDGELYLTNAMTGSKMNVTIEGDKIVEVGMITNK